jgi:cytochrome c5
VPSLDRIGERLTRAWVRAHLLEPMDVRPALFASMPRLDIAEAEAEAMATYLVPREAEPAAFSAQQASRGRDLYEQLGCASCHVFTGVSQRVRDGRYSTALGAERTSQPAPAAIELAPDLAWTRSRFQSGRLVAWIADAPRAKPGTLMPGLALSRDQASALAAFIMTTPLPERSDPEVPARLPVLDREVGYDEVARRVFRKVCWHCHASPDYARGDGGPGMSGGFGFAGRGLDLSSYTGVAAGSLGPDGRRRSVFSPVHEGTPRLVAHLWARHAEEAGRPVPGIRGMPLGLPALPPEEIQLVDSWIAQGRPR